MLTSLTPLNHNDLPVLAPALSCGFPRLSYSIDVLDGVLDPPDEMVGVGFDITYMRTFLPQLPKDPLRRKIASGGVHLGATPMTFENTGTAVIVDGQTLPGDPSLLRWCHAHGICTGVSFRVPLDQGRCGSLHFYSPDALCGEAVEASLPALFLAGHRAHTQFSEQRTRPRSLLLSRRETECLEAMARGGSNGQIARELGLSAETIKEYAHSLFRKLKVRNRAEAVSKGHALYYLRHTP